jgi:hypothetical protein
MLLESMLDDGDNDQQNSNHLAQQNQSITDSNREFLLLDANENLTVSIVLFFK